jgi:hypothetical protein
LFGGSNHTYHLRHHLHCHLLPQQGDAGQQQRLSMCTNPRTLGTSREQHQTRLFTMMVKLSLSRNATL